MSLAAPRQCIELHFDEKYSIEPSWECKFDHIEVRDGPFGFSPIIGRFCGQQNPPMIKSSGRFLWIKFFADGELESIGFSARYNFTPGKYKPSHFLIEKAYHSNFSNDVSSCCWIISLAGTLFIIKEGINREEIDRGHMYFCIASKAYSREKKSDSEVFKSSFFKWTLFQNTIQNVSWEVMCFMLDCYTVQLFFQKDHW